jgi:flavin reductase (DIM6/NTAB) family NADH-FMN oxidoreductase RutF
MKKEYKRRNFAPGTLEAPLPPAMVTVGDFENANVLTVAWTGILATHPPRTYVSVRPSRHSYGILKEKGEFVINLPSVELARTVDFVGIYTGVKVDKFEKCGLTKKQSEKVAPPTIAECPIALECRVAEVLPMGTHDVFVADIVNTDGNCEYFVAEFRPNNQ